MRTSSAYIRMLPGWMIACVVGLALIGCDAAGTPDFEEDFVVEAFLEAEAPLPRVRVSRSIALDRTYDANELAVQGAAVTITQVDEAGSVLERYSYAESPDSVGIYVPQLQAGRVALPRVQPLGRYRLDVRIPQADARLSARTIVPDTFSVVTVNRDSVEYRNDEQVEITITPSRYPGRDQTFYIYSTESLEPVEENLTPLVRAFYEDSDGELTLEDLRITPSPALNEAGYGRNPDGTISIRLPWAVIAFYGPNRLSAYAIDDNTYDYVRSQAAQQGGGGFTPGTIPSIIEYVEGGRGIFGAYARQSYLVYIARGNEAP